MSSSSIARPRVLLVGGTGFLGRHVAAALRQRNADVVVLSRRAAGGSGAAATLVWDTSTRSVDPRALAGVDRVCFLAGANIMEQRLTEARRAECEASRIDGTHIIVDALRKVPPIAAAHLCSC